MPASGLPKFITKGGPILVLTLGLPFVVKEIQARRFFFTLLKKTGD